MTMAESHAPVAPGEPAPDFTLAALDGKDSISLSAYRGRSSVFLALMRGLWCPFCRRAIAQMASTDTKLKALGVESVGVVATTPENARLYFKFRPTRLRLGADPELLTHRAFRLPKPPATPELMEAVGALRVNPLGELPEPLPVKDAAVAAGKFDGYTENDTDHADMEQQFGLLKGQFLIDREGIVRWANVECAKEGLPGIGKFPSEEEILAAAHALTR